MENKSKLKWKDIYKENLNRKVCEIEKIKNYDIGIESNPINALKARKYLIAAFFIIVTILLIITFRQDIKVLFMVLGFIFFSVVFFTIFNYFKFECKKEGLYIKFGMQAGMFPYDKVKSVYLSRFNDNNIMMFTNNYNIVIRYMNSLNRIKELSFPVHFLNKEETVKFLDNFELKEEPKNEFVFFERKKLLKKIAKFLGIIFIVVFVVIASFYMNTNI